MEPETVTALVVRCIEGDDAARAELIGRYDDLIRRAVARKLEALSTNSDVAGELEDICHEVYVRLFKDDCRALRRLRKPGSIDAWLMTIAQNEVYSHLRKRGSRLSGQQTIAREAPGAYSEGPEQHAIVQEHREILETVLSAMEDRDRLILQLYYIHDLKYAEIADALSLNINTVATRLARARLRLRERLSGLIQ